MAVLSFRVPLRRRLSAIPGVTLWVCILVNFDVVNITAFLPIVEVEYVREQSRPASTGPLTHETCIWE